MLDVQIIDFSVQVQAEFQQPRIKSDADPISLTRQITEAFGDVLDVQNVVLAATNDLFGYSLTLPLFRGASDIIVNSQSVAVAFRNGKNRQALNYIVESICKICGITITHAVRLNRVHFTAVASFSGAEEYHEYMKRFENPAKAVTSGGTIVFASGKTVAGEIRLSIEKALGFENSLFISAAISTTDPVRSDLFNQLGERLAELVQLQELNLKLL